MGFKKLFVAFCKKIVLLFFWFKVQFASDSKINMEEKMTQVEKGDLKVEKKELTREEIIAYNEQRKVERIQKASERNAFVANPEGGESQVFYSLGKSVEMLFRTSRRQEIKLNVVPIHEMEARIEYKKALVEFSSTLKQIGKKLGKEYAESPIIKDFRKNLVQEEAILTHIKESLSPKIGPAEQAPEATTTEAKQPKTPKKG